MASVYYSSPYQAAYKSAKQSPYLPANGGMNILIEGDSWMNQFADPESAVNIQRYLNIPGATYYNNATSSHTLIDHISPQLIAHLDEVARPSYDIIMFDGSANDLPLGDGTVTVQDLKDALVPALLRALQETNNVVYISTVPLNEGAALPTGYWREKQTLYDIEAVAAEFDEWAEAYCNLIGVKFFNANDVMALGDWELEVAWQDPPITNHLGSVGAAYMAGQLRTLLTSAALPVTNARVVGRARPNPELLTAADCNRIYDVVTALGDEWDDAVELWLLDQTDVTAAGNALTGLKTGAVLLPRSGTAGSVVETVTHDSTPGALGVALSASEYLRHTITPNSIGRTLSVGIMYQTVQDFSVNPTILGCCAADYFSSILAIAFTGDTLISANGLTLGVDKIESTTDPSTVMGKVLEVQTVEDGSNQTVTLYESGVAGAGPTSRTFSSPLQDYDIVFGGVRYGTFFSAHAKTKTIGAIYITNGTTTPATWAAAIE